MRGYIRDLVGVEPRRASAGTSPRSWETGPPRT